jgi:hypothetical protein
VPADRERHEEPRSAHLSRRSYGQA